MNLTSLVSRQVSKTVQTVRIAACCALASAAIPAAAADDATWDPAKLIAEKTCNMCHGKDSIGNQSSTWKQGPHANAVKLLHSEEAKQVGAKVGVADPASSPKCLKCHSTAYGFTENIVSTDIAVEDGVTCQSCHGGGKDYKIKHRNATVEERRGMGMIYPTAANTCRKCHNDQSPTYRTDRYTTPDGKAVDFDYEQAHNKIRHDLKK